MTLLKITIACILLIAPVCRLTAQPGQKYVMDSLGAHYLSLINTEPTDTGKIKLWHAYGNSIVWMNNDSAQRIFERNISESRRLKYIKGILANRIALSASYMDEGNYTESLKLLEEGLEDARSAHPPDSSAIEKIYNNFAGIYLYYGDYNTAADYFFRSVFIAEKTASPKSLARSYLNLANVLNDLHEPDKAMHYLQMAKKIADSQPAANYLQPYVYSNESSILMSQGHFNEAIKACRFALQKATLYHMTAFVTDVNNQLGTAYEEKGQQAKAEVYFKRALQVAEAYPLGRMRACRFLGNMYLSQHQYKLAEDFLSEALTAASTLQAKPDLQKIYENLASLYQNTERYAKAFDCIKRADTLKDTLMNVDKMRSVSLMEIRFRTAQKDKEIVQKQLLIVQQQNNLIKKNTWIGMITGIALLLGVASLFFYFYKQRTQKQQNVINTWRAMVKGEEKERVRMARELHDGIGGMLSTVRMHFGTIQKRYASLNGADDYRDAMSLLDSTVTEVRSTAHNLMPELLLRNGLPEAVRIFCHHISKDDTLQVDFQYYGLVDRYEESLELSIYRIIQELVQNILKHANATQALVQLSQHSDTLSVTVEDNGIGMQGDYTQSSGLGLHDIRLRVKDLNGTFSLVSGPDKGTSVHLEFNLIQNKLI